MYKEYFFVSFYSKSIDLEICKKRRIASSDLIAILKRTGCEFSRVQTFLTVATVQTESGMCA